MCCIFITGILPAELSLLPLLDALWSKEERHHVENRDALIGVLFIFAEHQFSANEDETEERSCR